MAKAMIGAHQRQHGLTDRHRREPTQGSWRPLATSSTSSPGRVTPRTGVGKGRRKKKPRRLATGLAIGPIHRAGMRVDADERKNKAVAASAGSTTTALQKTADCVASILTRTAASRRQAMWRMEQWRRS